MLLSMFHAGCHVVNAGTFEFILKTFMKTVVASSMILLGVAEPKMTEPLKSVRPSVLSTTLFKCI